MNIKNAVGISVGLLLSQIGGASTFNMGNTPNGQAFVSACAGSQTYGGQPNPGGSGMITGGEAPFNSCNQAQGTAVATGLLLNPVVNPPLFQAPTGFTSKSEMSAQPGGISFFATSTNTAADIFAGGWGSGGWNDSFIWQGQTGMWMPKLDVTADLTDVFDNQCDDLPLQPCPASFGPQPPTGEAVLEVSMTLNGSLLSSAEEMSDFEANNPNAHPSIPILAGKFGDWGSSVGFEMGGFVADATTPNVDALDQKITFAIPVVHGQPVNFGVYASYLVSGGDSYDGYVSTQTIDPTTTFAGPGTLNIGTPSNPVMVPVLPGDIGPSVSGVNYSRSFTLTPEPGTAVFGALAVVLGLAARRSRR